MFEAAPGGSSTMPQKRNPLAASIALAAAARAPGLVATLLGAMPQEHERGLGGWQAEWETLPVLVRIAGGAARAMADALGSLVVDTARMRANLEATRGLIYAEAVAMALAQKVGKHQAHSVVAAACGLAVATGRSLRDVLASDPRVTAHLSAADIGSWFELDAYQGAAQEFVARVVRAQAPGRPERTERAPGRSDA